MRAARLTVAAAGIVIVAWFALGARQAHDLSLATDIVSQNGTVSATQAARASSLLDSAATLNPDQQVKLVRGALAIDRSQYGRARSVLTQVTNAEPLNLEAWLTLAHATGGQPELELHVLKTIARLHPKVP